MLFSGKITNSFLVFLEQNGVDAEKLFEATDLPRELLREPSCWIPAPEVEKFVASADQQFGSRFPEDGLAKTVGHQCHQLRAWGVLDSVMRMLPTPQDLFLQPHRFLSYFVSPAPPVGNVVRESDTITFDLPISNQEFPFVVEFLRCSLESLPCYLGRAAAQVHWRQTRIQISWSESQNALLKDDDLAPNYKPELVQNLMQTLEEQQRQNEELRAQLNQQQATSHPNASVKEDAEFVQGLRAQIVRTRGHMMRLSDYLVRSQQLVTLLIGQDRMDRQIQEAMRRVDWEYIKSQSTLVAQETVDLLSQFEGELNQRVRRLNKEKSKQGSLNLQLTN